MCPSSRPSKRVSNLLGRVERTLDQEYSRDAQRQQHILLLALLRLRRGLDERFTEFGNVSDLWSSSRPIEEWCDTNTVLFPNLIQNHMNGLRDGVRAPESSLNHMASP
jgi:hypothetical protein